MTQNLSISNLVDKKEDLAKKSAAEPVTHKVAIVTEEVDEETADYTMVDYTVIGGKKKKKKKKRRKRGDKSALGMSVSGADLKPIAED